MDGAMGSAELKYLLRDTDRHGNERIYVRRRGYPKVRIRAPEGTDEFLAEYRSAAQGLRAPLKPARRIAAKGSFDELVMAACNSPEWSSRDPQTILARRHILEDWADTLTPKSQVRVGSVPAAKFTAINIRKRRDALAKKQPMEGAEAGRRATRARGGPAAANNFLKAVRALFNWAVERSDETGIKTNPAEEVKRIQYRKSQYHVWTPDELASYRAKWPLGTKQRLACELGIGTSQRPSDVRQLGRQHVRRIDGVNELHYTQHKGRARQPMEMVTPILPELQAAIDAMPQADGLIFVPTRSGTPYKEHSFHNCFKDWCRAANVPECSPHGLRILSAVTMLEAGISVERLMAWFGWRTLELALHYAQTFNRANMNRETARALMDQTKNKSVPLSSPSQESGTISARK